jgi:hypothetical protein
MDRPSKAEREAEMARVMEEQYRADPLIQQAVYAEVGRRYPDLVARYRERMRRSEWDE